MSINLLSLANLCQKQNGLTKKQQNQKWHIRNVDIDKQGKFYGLELQIEETAKYLTRNKEKLSCLKKVKGIDYATLSFGIDLGGIKKNGVQSHFFPRQFLQLISELDLDIELSIYPMKSNLDLLEKPSTN